MVWGVFGLESIERAIKGRFINMNTDFRQPFKKWTFALNDYF
jgi:hypothetical protein